MSSNKLCDQQFTDKQGDKTMSEEQRNECPLERVVMPTLHFVTNSKTPHKLPDGSYELRRSVAVLGTLLPLTKADLCRYVRLFPLAWVEA